MHKQPKISVEKVTYTHSCTVVGVQEKKKLSSSASALDKKVGGSISAALKSGFEPKEGSLRMLHGKHSVFLVGLGNNDITSEKFLDLMANAFKVVRAEGMNSCAVLVDSFGMKGGAGLTAQAAVMGLHRFVRFKTRKVDELKNLENIALLVSAPEKVKKEVSAMSIIGQAVIRTRDLVNSPPNVAHPDFMESYARKLAKANGLKCEVLQQKDLLKKGMGCIEAVGKGSHHKPRMVILKYNGGGKQAPVILVGKGVCFDTGGYNLKPSPHISLMKDDKGGACAVLHAIEALARLKVKANVVAICGFVENMISGHAYLPDDVLKAYNGVTVEIGNTDAEGRLVLADCLSYGAEMKPKAMIDIATLTGASIIALGLFTVSMVGNDDEVVKSVLDSAAAGNERMWQLPLYDEFQDAIKSDVADLNNISDGPNAGVIIGGAFLKNFVGDTKWAHLDIGSTVHTKAEKGIKQKGATGVGVRTLIEFVRAQV